MKKTVALILALIIGHVSNVHAGGCMYLVEAHLMSKKITFLSDIVELGYPAGSKKCNQDSSGNHLNREGKFEKQFLSLIRDKNPGLDISGVDIHAKWFPDEREPKMIQQMASSLATSGQSDARGNRVILLPGHLYPD
jgi:hypothetical protein